MKRNFLHCGMAIFLVLSYSFCFANSTRIVYGLENAKHVNGRIKNAVYIQVGSFVEQSKAHQYQRGFKSKTRYPVKVVTKGQLYTVLIGPIHSSTEVRKTAISLLGSSKQLSVATKKPSFMMVAKPPKQYAPVHATYTETVPETYTPSQIPAINLSQMKPTIIKSKAPATFSLNQTARRFLLAQQDLHPELSLFLGGSYVPNTIKGQTLQLLPYEIGEYADTFTNQSSASAFTWGLDAQYRFKLHAPSIQNYFLDSLGAGVDIFQITNLNQTGKVLQFNLPEFENYTYTLKLNNIRIMADFDLDFHPIRQDFIPFIEAGIGGARTVVSYTSVPIAPVDSPNFTLPDEASWGFAYQAGAGVKYVAKTHLVLSLRYLYANMGKVNSSILGSSTTLVTPLVANMSTQNVLFGLTYIV